MATGSEVMKQQYIIYIIFQSSIALRVITWQLCPDENGVQITTCTNTTIFKCMYIFHFAVGQGGGCSLKASCIFMQQTSQVVSDVIFSPRQPLLVAAGLDGALTSYSV